MDARRARAAGCWCGTWRLRARVGSWWSCPTPTSLAGAALGLPLEAQPELAATIENAARVAAWYWNNGCTPLADAGHFEALTRRINGGTNGLEDRIERYKRALGALERTTT